LDNINYQSKFNNDETLDVLIKIK